MKLNFNCIVIIFLLIATTSCSWVKEDLSVCPHGLWLNLRYTYNMLDVDAASTQVKDMTLFIFDERERYIEKINFSENELKKTNYNIELEDIKEGTYSFILLSELADSNIVVSDLVPGESVLQDFQFRLNNNNHEIFSRKIEPLFYGMLSNVTYDGIYRTEQVDLVKDTNQVACILRSSDSNNIDFNDYDIYLESDNGCYQYNNSLIKNHQTTYTSYEKDNVIVDDLSTLVQQNAGRYALNTLRLMKNDNTRLKIIYKPTSTTVVDMPLTSYLLQVAPLYTQLGHTLEEQEYLDRQDFYTLIFYFSSLKDNVCLLKLSVNGWVIRLNDNIEFKAIVNKESN